MQLKKIILMVLPLCLVLNFVNSTFFDATYYEELEISGLEEGDKISKDCELEKSLSRKIDGLVVETKIGHAIAQNEIINKGAFLEVPTLPPNS